jgi:DNA-directed RNA polymerase subunit RPC12/RpoP
MDRRKKEKDLNMKTIITLAIVALISATAARAEVITKGGASALMKAPTAKAGTPVAAMKCATCKSEFVTVKVPTFKGSAPETSLVERHACTSCGTKWVTTGHGKAKVEVAKHTCGGCTL